MDELKITCNECGTENEQQYEFCKNCGAPLRTKEPISSEPAPGYSGNTNVPPEQNMYSPYTPVETIDGISLDEMSAFIGKKAYSVIPKFLSMVRRNSNISWCWPVAILSWIFGPFGAALWFFYRKLHKAAWLCVLSGLILSVLVTFPTLKDFPVNLGEMIDDISFAMESSEPGEAEYAVQSIIEGYVEELNEFVENYDNRLVSAVNDIANIITVVLSGMFAYSIYKRKAVETIMRYRSTNVDPRYYQMGLMSLGGTSGGLLALGIALMLIVPIVTVWILMAVMLF